MKKLVPYTRPDGKVIMLTEAQMLAIGPEGELSVIDRLVRWLRTLFRQAT